MVTADQDHVATRGIITFPTGTTNLTRTIAALIIDNTVDGHDEERFYMVVSNLANTFFIMTTTVIMEIVF